MLLPWILRHCQVSSLVQMIEIETKEDNGHSLYGCDFIDGVGGIVCSRTIYKRYMQSTSAWIWSWIRILQFRSMIKYHSGHCQDTTVKKMRLAGIPGHYIPGNIVDDLKSAVVSTVYMIEVKNVSQTIPVFSRIPCIRHIRSTSSMEKVDKDKIVETLGTVQTRCLLCTHSNLRKGKRRV